MKDGYGYKKWASGNEYYGQYKNDLMDGEGVFQKQGQLYNVKYEQDKLMNKTKISGGC
jgi:hypothetical protein